MKRFGICALVFISLWGGCSLAPEYTRAPAPVPGSWPQGQPEREPENPELISAISWSEFFPDERVQKISAFALENSRDLKLAVLNVERVRALYDIQRSDLYPAVSAVGEGMRQRQSADLVGSSDSRESEQYSLKLGVVSWQIDFFGQIRSLSDRALEEYLASEEVQRAAKVALMSEVARAFLALAGDRENLNLAQSTLAAQQKAYQLIKKKYEVGVATELDLSRAQISVDSTRADLERYTQLVALDLNALTLAVGATLSDELLPSDFKSVVSSKAIPGKLSSEVLFRRPDIMAAEHRLKGAYASIGAARAALFPTISLTSSIGTASEQLSGLFKGGRDTWSFVPQVSMPIFDTRMWAALRVSKADREIAQAQYEKAVQSAFREVADALAIASSIDTQIDAQRSLVKASDNTYRLSNKRYQAGVDSYLGVLDAQRNLFSAEQKLVELQILKETNRVKLYAALGGE